MNNYWEGLTSHRLFFFIILILLLLIKPVNPSLMGVAAGILIVVIAMTLLHVDRILWED